MAKFKPKASSLDDEYRVSSEESLDSSTNSKEKIDDSQEMQSDGGSLHDPTPKYEAMVCHDKEDSNIGKDLPLSETKLEDLTEADYRIDFEDSDDHVVCLINARLPTLTGQESDPLLRAIQQLYQSEETNQKAIGTLLHACLRARRLVFALSRNTLGALLSADPNIASINRGINNTLYRRVWKLIYELKVFKEVVPSEEGPRGVGKPAIIEVVWKPLVAYIGQTRGQSPTTLKELQQRQLEEFRGGREVPRSLFDQETRKELLKITDQMAESVDLKEIATLLEQAVITIRFRAMVPNESEELATEINERLGGRYGASACLLLEQIAVMKKGVAVLDQVPWYVAASGPVVHDSEFYGLIDTLHECSEKHEAARLRIGFLRFLEEYYVTLKQRVMLGAWIDRMVDDPAQKDELWQLVMKKEESGVPLERPSQQGKRRK